MDPIIIFVKGQPSIGKSSVAHSLSGSMFKLDLGDLDYNGALYNNGIVKEAKKDKLGKLIKKYGKGDRMNHFYGEVDKNGLDEEYANILMDKFENKPSPFIVDGAISDSIFKFLTKKLIDNNYRVWCIERIGNG
jgi:hypothetical protein